MTNTAPDVCPTRFRDSARNSQDGWWIYKYYQDSRGGHTSWPERQKLLKKQIADVKPDFLCLQELSELSFEEDFGFLREAGYEVLLHEKKGRMRPASAWRLPWRRQSAQHKDRSLVIALENGGRHIFLVNLHLSAGANADRRLRQVHEALETVEKEAKKMQLDPQKLPVICAGDFNSQGLTAVRELLTVGAVGPEFRESGDPTERGQEGKQITSKLRKHGLAPFQDASEQAHAGPPPATILAQNIDDKMLNPDGSLTAAMCSALDEAFQACGPQDDVLSEEAVGRFLVKINRQPGRGSEHRFVQEVFAKGEPRLTRADFHALYSAELAEGKFWGVEHDLRELRGHGLATPSEGPCQLRFDYIYFSMLELRGVREILSEAQFGRIFGAPYETLPNAWHPSDHLPVIASFAFL